MRRNLNHRVEMLFPVENKRLVARLRDGILAKYLTDNRNARHMRADGTWTWDKTGEPALDSQAQFVITPRLASSAIVELPENVKTAS